MRLCRRQNRAALVVAHAFQMTGDANANIAMRALLLLEDFDQSLLTRHFAERRRARKQLLVDHLVRRHQQTPHCYQIAPGGIVIGEGDQDLRAQKRLRRNFCPVLFAAFGMHDERIGEQARVLSKILRMKIKLRQRIESCRRNATTSNGSSTCTSCPSPAFPAFVPLPLRPAVTAAFSPFGSMTTAKPS